MCKNLKLFLLLYTTPLSSRNFIFLKIVHNVIAGSWLYLSEISYEVFTADNPIISVGTVAFQLQMKKIYTVNAQHHQKMPKITWTISQNILLNMLDCVKVLNFSLIYYLLENMIEYTVRIYTVCNFPYCGQNDNIHILLKYK